MAAGRTDRHRQQEGTGLHRLGKSTRRIARQLSTGRNTVRYVDQETVALRNRLEGVVRLIDRTSPGFMPAVPPSATNRISGLRERFVSRLEAVVCG